MVKIFRIIFNITIEHFATLLRSGKDSFPRTFKKSVCNKLGKLQLFRPN